jgi:acetylglutamate synthase
MDFSYNNYNNFSTQHASPSGRTPAPINYTHNCYPHKPCSYCSNPYHSSSNCPSWGRSSNFSYDQRNTNFSSPGFESNSNVYNSDWRNHPNFSWQAQAMGNCAPQYHELHNLAYPQFDHKSSNNPSSYDRLPQRLSLEETLQAFIQTSNRNIQELKKVTMSNQMMQELKSVTMSNNQAMQELKTASISNNENIQNLAKIEGHIDYLVAEFNRMEEEELQSQLMAEGHYMSDEDDASHSCHEYVPDTTILESKEIVDNNEEEGKDEQIEHIGEEGKEEQIVDDKEEQEEKDE